MFGAQTCAASTSTANAPTLKKTEETVTAGFQTKLSVKGDTIKNCTSSDKSIATVTSKGNLVVKAMAINNMPTKVKTKVWVNSFIDSSNNESKKITVTLPANSAKSVTLKYPKSCLLCTGLSVTKANAATNISVVNITIEEPAVGAKPATTATVPDDASYYVKEVIWGPVSSKFEAEKAYQLSVTIAVKDGLDAQFVLRNGNSAIDAKINGNQAKWYHSNSSFGKVLYVKYTFPAMEKVAVADKGDTKNGGAISSAADLLKLRVDPSGSYYLTKDITVPKNTQIFDDHSAGGTAFTGTFDGKGHKIKGYTASVNASAYTNVSLFGKTKDATFKNLTLSGVNINVKSDHGASAGYHKEYF